MVSCEKFGKNMHSSVFQKRTILYVFEKLTGGCFSQIALETILLPTLMAQMDEMANSFFHTKHHCARIISSYVSVSALDVNNISCLKRWVGTDIAF